MSSVLCLTPPFLCANPELTEDDEKELPKNVVDPLYTSSPLSVLEPNNLSQYETETYTLSLFESEPITLSHYESEPKNLSHYESEPITLSHYESEPVTLSLYESDFKNLPQNEMVASCSPLSAYLSPPVNGTGGGSGHSTVSLRSLPPTLQPRIWEVVKTACLSYCRVERER